MKTPSKTCRSISRALFLLMASALPGMAQSIWTGTSGTDINWATGANWSTTVAPGAADAVVFGNNAITNAAGAAAVNNEVTASQTILSLAYSVTNSGVSFHNTLLHPGVTLTISGGAGNALFAGSGTDQGTNTTIGIASIFGSGATLDFESPSANINIRQGSGNGTVGLSGTNHSATLDMSGLDRFIANAGRLLISGDGAGGGNVSRLVGVLYLAKTNTITLTGTGPQLQISEQPSNGRANPPIGLAPSFLFLGQTNAIFADSIKVGGSKSPPVSMLFNPAFVNPSVYIRGQSSARVTTYSIGDNSVQTTSNQGSDGTNDFSGGRVDLMVDTMYVGRGENGGGNAAGTGGGVLNYGQGTIDVNNLEIGYQSASGSGPAIGTVNINGGTLIVNGNLRLARYVGGAGVPQGTLNAQNATIQAGGLLAGGGAVNFNLVNSTLLSSSNAFGAVGSALASFSISDSTLTLSAGNGDASVVTTNLNLGGATNKINISSIPVVSGYPAVIPIIKYSTLNGTPNLGLGTLPVSTPAYKGYLTNNSTAQAYNLVLTNGPAPARTLNWTGQSGTPNWDQDNTLNWKTNGGPATTFHDLDFVRFDDTALTNEVSLLGFPLLPSDVTVSNVTKNYLFDNGGYLSGNMSLTKDGSGKLIVDNTTPNDFTGGLIISNGSVQVGNGDTFGNLGAGAVVNNGTIIFDRIDFNTTTNAISGTGSLLVVTNGTLILSGANSFDGAVTVQRGTLVVDNNSALGSTNGGTVVNSGGRLDVGGADLAANALNPGLEQITVSGAGPDGNGALYNSSGNSQQNALRLVTLAGDTVLGGTGRFDIRGAGATLSTGNQPYSLMKTGLNEVVIVDTAVDPALGDIDIQQGQLQIQGNTTSLGNSASNLFVRAGGSLFLNATTNLLDKNFNLFGDGSTITVEQTGGSSTIVGPMTLNGNTRFTAIGTGTALILSNNISGSGTFTVSTPGTNVIVMAGPAKTYTGGTTVTFGKLQLNTSLSGGGGLTNFQGAWITGSGTNAGAMEIGGNFSPAGDGVRGNFGVGGGLTVQGSANLNIDLGPDNTVGQGSNDLIQVTGNVTTAGGTVNVNPIGLLRTGQPYRLMNYSGNLISLGDMVATGPNNYTFTIATNIHGQINIIPSGGPAVWTGGSAVGGLWTDAANWGGTAVNGGQTVYFAGTTRLNNTNDFTGQSFGLGFDVGAGSFDLYGNPITLSDNIVSTSPNVQTLHLDLNLDASRTINGGSGGIVIGGHVTNTLNAGILTLAGSGTLSNSFVNSDTNIVSNTLALTSASANWTIVDNPTSTAITNTMQLDIQGGTLNFGTPSSAPVLSSVTAVNSRLGVVPNVPGTLNMVNGTLKIAARFNTGAAANAVGILNQSGGTFTVVSLFQGADSSSFATNILNISGGSFNVGDPGAANMFLASRGVSTLTISGTGAVKCATLDLSRNAAGNTAASQGTVNLDGGTLTVNRVGTATSAAQTGNAANAVAQFNFNGGTLIAGASSATFFQGNTGSPNIPITAIVKAGGAIIDSSTRNITVLEPLQHDSNLGATADGGLIKKGTGTLTLSSASTYNGLTLVSNGTLLVNGSISTGAVSVATSGTLAGNGTIGGGVTVDGTIGAGTATAIGRLTVQSNVTITGTNTMKLDKGNNTNDVLVVSGTLTYGGVLNLTNLSGTLVGGESFKLFNAGAYSGTFTSLNPATPGPNLAWDTSALSSGILAVTSTATGPTTNANITSVSLSGTNLLIHGTNNNVPNNTGHYVVLTATNINTPLANWTPVVTNSYNGDGTFDYTSPIVPGTPQQFIGVEALP